MDRLEGAINRRLERRVIAGADLLTLTSDEARAYVPGADTDAVERKTAILPHAYDASLYRNPEGSRGKALRLLYVGNFYEPRSPEPLFEALARLLEERPETASEIAVELVGRIAPGMLDTPLARRLTEKRVVRSLPPVDYLASLCEMRDADVLVVVDAPSERSPFLPSKLVDYIGARRPVVALSPPGPAAHLTERFGGWAANPSSPAEAAGALTNAIDWARANRGRDFGDDSVYREFDNRVVGARLGDLLASLTA
jgi:glycosyltransferase involved in cell wall biosynthesis